MWIHSPNKDVAYENFQLHDLTLMFGAGNEPTTVEEFESLYGNMPSEYNEGEIIDNKVSSIKSVGTNIWDEEWEYGMYSIYSGEKVESSDVQIRSTNKIQVFPNTTYYFEVPDEQWGWLIFYDSSNIFISSSAITNKNFTTPPNAQYMTFHMNGSYGTTYNHDICINLSDESINGKYFPYEDFVRELPTIDGGLKSAGNVCDEIRYNVSTDKWEYVKRIGSVDLGTLEFRLLENSTFLSERIEDRMFSSKFNAISSKYNVKEDTVQAGSSVTNSVEDNFLQAYYLPSNPEPVIYVKDSTYTDVATFKAAMNGVILYYELAEPIVAELSDDYNLSYQISKCGTVEAISDGLSSPFKGEIEYSTTIANKINSNIRQIEYLDNKIDEISDSNNLIKVTYNELVSLRNNSQLKPGYWYRITDYVTTTSQENTMSAGHQFDVLVLATDVNVLSEEARAINHEGDTYFESCNLNAWKIWYSLDNDESRFAWAGEPNIDIKVTIKSDLLESDGITFKETFEQIHRIVIDEDSDLYTKQDTENFMIVQGGKGKDLDDNLALGFPYPNALCLIFKDYKVDDEDVDMSDLTIDDKGVFVYRGRTTIEDVEYDLWEFYWYLNNNWVSGNVYYTTKIVTELNSSDVILTQKCGIIYRMIDEWGNDCPYDFKNIKFLRMLDKYGYIIDEDGSPVYVYTFNWYNENGICEDLTLRQDLTNEGDNKFGTYNNIIKPYYKDMITTLNDIVFLNSYYYDGGIFYGCYNNTFGNNCFDISFGNSCEGNSFGNSCYNNEFGDDCLKNSFGDECHTNTFGNLFYSNIFGNKCRNNTFGVEFGYNTFGDECYNNEFGDECLKNSFGNVYCYNTFGNNCFSNSFVNNCRNNTFGNNCYNNSFGYYCHDNTFGDNCEGNSFSNNCEGNSFDNNCGYNSFSDYCQNNSFGTECYNNSFGIECTGNMFDVECRNNSFGNGCFNNLLSNVFVNNSFGNDCYDNSFGEYCSSNSFGNSCYSNSFGNYCSNNSFGKGCESNSFIMGSSYDSEVRSFCIKNIFENGVSFVKVYNTSTASNSYKLQNVTVCQGMSGKSGYPNYVEIPTLNASYQIKVAKNSAGNIKVYCEADLIGDDE